LESPDMGTKRTSNHRDTEATERAATPLTLLLPFQRDWVNDESRFKIWLAARQIGKSFAASCEAVRDCYLRPGSMWVILSAGERQALEFMEKVRQWVQAFELIIEAERIDREGPDAVLKSAEIRLGNGSRIIALPANPDTARGYSANLILDEFAFHKDSAAIWRAILPSIANPLRRELKVRVLSTPNGQGNKFYEMWTDTTGAWSKHKTTIHDAKAKGLNVDIEGLKRGVGDMDGWRQEFECEFIDTQRVAFPYELIAGAETPEASTEWQGTAKGPLYVGIDVGSLHDPTACITAERVDGRLIVREALVLRGVELADQDAWLAPRIARAARTSIDASGLGLDIAQRMARLYGDKVVAQRVTAQWKRQAFTAMQIALRDKLVGIPASREWRDDMHAYIVTGAGETAQYRAPRTDEGHSDITSALVHMLDAATQSKVNYFAEAIL